MEDYRTLFSLQVYHEYFEEYEEEMMEVRIYTEPVSLLKDRQLLFKKNGKNRWILIGNVEGGGVYEGRDSLRFEFVLRDPAFGYYTDWEEYDSSVFYEMEMSDSCREVEVAKVVRPVLEKRKKAGVLFTGKLALTDRMFEEARVGKCCEVCLNFRAKEMFWEYMFIPGRQERKEWDLVLEEQDGKLLFSKPVPLKVDFIDKPVWRSLSQKAVKMKNVYHYQLDLLEMIRENPEMKRKIIKNVEYPVPGAFHDLKGNYLRRIVYF